MEIEGRNHGVTIAKKPWHTKGHAGKSTGKPQNFKKKNGSDGRAFQTMSADSQGPQINSEKPNSQRNN
ncbi:hypothetical protein CK203_078605 [Vitis vinifera]|uniref:Uncharacterized protein n=1 Tax=Vitis vinifera TaxID=29760 RepID=A0A438C3J1_VITVI|nr:hypothetical protein CK203_078605 [Vitis vinifera]